MKKLLIGLGVAVVSASAFAQYEPNDMVQGKTKGYHTFLTSPFLEWKKVDILLEAKVVKQDEVKNTITLTDVVVSSGYAANYKIQVTTRAKKFICESFNFNTLRGFDSAVGKKYVKIRSLDSYATEEYDIVENDGKIVFQTIECDL